jgi:hypothetical protein
MTKSKILEAKNTFWGRKTLKSKISKLEADGWVVKSYDEVGQGFDASATCCLGCLFLPLALLGRKPNKPRVVMTKEVSE